MSCFKPIPAWMVKGSLSFSPDKNGQHTEVEIPCNNCIGCRIDRARDRTIRCINEASMWKDNCFITLTYDNENLPKDHNLNWEHVKSFMRRLRSKLDYTEGRKIRFYACGEYGGDLINKDNVWFWDRSSYKEKYERKGFPLPTLPRPHYHAILFNWWPEDSVFIHQNKLGDKLFTSETMRLAWKKGNVSHGTVTPESCGYVARYMMKKQNTNEKVDFIAKYGQPIYDLETGEYICEHPTKPEMAFGSNRQPIGATWLEKYWETDCFSQGFIMGPPPKYSKYSIPRYYWDWLELNHREEWKVFKQLKDEQFIKRKDKIEADNTYQRLESKEFILNKQTSKLKRAL